MVFSTGLYFPELSSKGKTISDQEAGRGFCTEPSPFHTKEPGGGEGIGEDDKKQIPKGLDPCGHCTLVTLLLEHPLPGSLLEQKRELSPPHKPSHPRFLLPHSILPHSLLPPRSPLTAILGLLRDPQAPVPCRHLQAIPSRHPPARDDRSPSSPVLDITCPSLHRPQTWQLPASTHPRLSPAPSLRERGQRPLRTPLDLKSLLVFAGLMSLACFELQTGSSGKQMLLGGT